jgi:hypothetical protein
MLPLLVLIMAMGAPPRPPFVSWVMAANNILCYGGAFDGTAHCPYLGTFETEALLCTHL